MHKAPQTIRYRTTPPAPNKADDAYDPELLYVECSRCGNPVIWEEGRTTKLLREAGLSSSRLDARHLVLTNGCPTCAPEEVYFETRVVRLADAQDQELKTMRQAEGNA